LKLNAWVCFIPAAATLLATKTDLATAAPPTPVAARAELSHALTETPPIDAADWRPVRLPTPVSKEDGPNAPIWYRLTFDLPLAPEGTWAIFIRRAEEHVVLFNESAAVPVAGHATASPASGWNYPRYFEVAGERLHAGHHVLYARVYPSSVGEHQLSVVMLGPASELLNLFRDQLVLQVIGPSMAGAVSAVVGLFMLALWLHRRSDTAFGWLGFACAFMILHFARFFVPGSLAPAWLRPVGDGAFGWMVLGLMLFVFRVAGRRYARAERFVAVYALAGTMLLFVAADRPAYVLIRDCYTVGLFPVDAGVLACQSILAWRTRAPMMIALALAAIATVGLGIHDLYVRNFALLDDTTFYLMPYCPLLLSLAAGGAVIERMVRSYRALDRLNVELEARVAAREAELARSYARAAELEKRAAIAGERRRIMRDMHDGLGNQLISSISLAESGALPSHEFAELLRRCIDELRLVIDSLKPLSDDLNAVLANFRYRFENRLAAAGLTLEWDVGDVPRHPSLTPDVILQIIRIVQEAFSNVIKHAGARRVSVTAHYDNATEVVGLRIADDGAGFDGGSLRPGDGFPSMKARAACLQAQLDIISGPGQGTDIRLALPLNRPRPSSDPATTNDAACGSSTVGK
jgi:signal transduction histidine kinase